MTEAEWLKCREPSPMFYFIEGTASIRRCRLLACALLPPQLGSTE